MKDSNVAQVLWKHFLFCDSGRLGPSLSSGLRLGQGPSLKTSAFSILQSSTSCLCNWTKTICLGVRTPLAIGPTCLCNTCTQYGKEDTLTVTITVNMSHFVTNECMLGA